MENQKAKAHWLTKPEVKREVVDSMYISTAYVNMVSFRGVGRFFLPGKMFDFMLSEPNRLLALYFMDRYEISPGRWISCLSKNVQIFPLILICCHHISTHWTKQNKLNSERPHFMDCSAIVELKRKGGWKLIDIAVMVLSLWGELRIGDILCQLVGDSGLLWWTMAPITGAPSTVLEGAESADWNIQRN